MVAVLVGVGCTVYGLVTWGSRAFGSLNPEETVRYAVPAATAVVLGFELILSSFFLSILGLARQEGGRSSLGVSRTWPSTPCASRASRCT